jgi:hypothetical protein
MKLKSNYIEITVFCDVTLYILVDIYTNLNYIFRKVAGLIPDEVIGFFDLPNPSSRTMALGSSQPLTEITTRNLPGGKGRPERKADNLTASCDPIV